MSVLLVGDTALYSIAYMVSNLLAARLNEITTHKRVVYRKLFGTDERTRTSTCISTLAPEASASTNSATSACTYKLYGAAR